jgi:hypothetical protein
MASVTVRRFVISLDPQEIVDFNHPIDYFQDILNGLGFGKSGVYTFRYSDAECMIKIELKKSPDGYFLWSYVQALDEHQYRLREIAEAFQAHVLGDSGGHNAKGLFAAKGK